MKCASSIPMLHASAAVSSGKLVERQRPDGRARRDEGDVLHVALFEVGEDAVEHLVARLVADRLAVVEGRDGAGAERDDEGVVAQPPAAGAAHLVGLRIDGGHGVGDEIGAEVLRDATQGEMHARPQPEGLADLRRPVDESGPGATSVTWTRAGARSCSAMSASSAATPPPAITTSAALPTSVGHADDARGESGAPASAGRRACAAGNPQAAV